LERHLEHRQRRAVDRVFHGLPLPGTVYRKRTAAGRAPRRDGRLAGPELADRRIEEVTMATLAIVGFVLSCVSIILAGVAYWRTGGRQDVMSVRDDVRRELGLVHERQKNLADETARWLRADYDETIARAQRARERIALARKEAADEVKS